MPPCSMTLSSSCFSSNWKPYWNPEHPPPWTKMRRGLPSESGMELAKYLTLSIAASVKESRGLTSPVGVIGVGGEATVDDMKAPFFEFEPYQHSAARLDSTLNYLPSR